MKTRKTWITALLAVAPLAAQAALPAYAPVTDARLATPESRNWLSYRGNYAGWGYSPLKQITSDNVGKLTLAWSYATGMKEGHQSPPMVNNGYMYITTPNNQVIAFEAATNSGSDLPGKAGDLVIEEVEAVANGPKSKLPAFIAANIAKRTKALIGEIVAGM